MDRFLWMLVCALFLNGPGFGFQNAAADRINLQNSWGLVQVGRDQNGHWQALLENDLIRCRYSWKPVNDSLGGESFISELLIKSLGQNQAAKDAAGDKGRIDACAHRYNMTYAGVEYDGFDRKTVVMTWKHRTADFTPVQKVTIFPDLPVLKIDYIQYGVNVVDIGNAGGGDHPRYIIYGAEKWKRGYVPYPMGFYYPPADTQVVRVTGMPGDEDPGPLNYKGYFIMAIYNEQTGVGFGRVVPVQAISIIKLLFKKGFELFPYWKQSKQPYTGFIYVFTGGAAEAIEAGKKIVDGISGISY